jgi:hypothetical protein
VNNCRASLDRADEGIRPYVLAAVDKNAAFYHAFVPHEKAAENCGFNSGDESVVPHQPSEPETAADCSSSL